MILLDHVMPVMNGAAVVAAIREFDSIEQVLLVTGYAEDRPGGELLRKLDIQDFHDKGAGPDRLMVQVDAALEHLRVVDLLRRQERRLVRMVEAGPERVRVRNSCSRSRSFAWSNGLTPFEVRVDGDRGPQMRGVRSPRE